MQIRKLIDVVEEREVFFLDNSRYQTHATAERDLARGRLSYWGTQTVNGEVKLNFLHHSKGPRYLDPLHEVWGLNDVWFTTPDLDQIRRMRREISVQSILHPFQAVRTITASEWYEKYCYGNVIFDLNIILYARGSKSDGRQGQTTRDAMVIPPYDIDPEISKMLDAEDGLFLVTGSNMQIDVLDLGEDDSRTGLLSPKQPFLSTHLRPDQLVYAAGRRMVFTDVNLVRELSEYGIVGEIEGAQPAKPVLTKYEREFVRKLRERVDERDRRISSRTLGVIEEEVVQVLRDMPTSIQPDSPERIRFS